MTALVSGRVTVHSELNTRTEAVPLHLFWRQVLRIFLSFVITLVCGFSGILFYLLSGEIIESPNYAERFCAYLLAWPLIVREHLGGVCLDRSVDLLPLWVVICAPRSQKGRSSPGIRFRADYRPLGNNQVGNTWSPIRSHRSIGTSTNAVPSPGPRFCLRAASRQLLRTVLVHLDS
jgi:hypothetical protein